MVGAGVLPIIATGTWVLILDTCSNLSPAGIVTVTSSILHLSFPLITDVLTGLGMLYLGVRFYEQGAAVCGEMSVV